MDDDRTEHLVRQLDLPPAIDLVYVRNRPPSGAARNIDRVFREASSEWLLLIHDDDWLLPEAIEHLTSPLRDGAAPDIIYGNQQVVDAQASIDEKASLTINPAFGRRPERAGLQPSPLWAAAIQQMPNDGFLVRSRLVHDIGYLTNGVTDGEYAFGVRAALGGASFFFAAARRFDLGICLEVAEHLPTAGADQLVENLVRLSDVILFSAAIPHQGGTHHVNEQWPSYWADLFAARHYFAWDGLRWLIWQDARIPLSAPAEPAGLRQPKAAGAISGASRLALRRLYA